MLTNYRAEVESPPVSDQSSAPPDWYPDPEDESQYRYWDGSAWTQHRAPRHVKQENPELLGLNRLIADSVQILRRQWRGCALPAALTIVAQLLTALLFVYSADLILMGEFDEVWAWLSEPDTADSEAYFESLEFDLSVWNFVPAAVALLLFWFTANLMTAAVSILAVGDRRGDTENVLEVFRQACRRVPRIFGLDLQVAGLGVLALALIVLAGVISPLLLLLAIPVFLIGFFLVVAIVPIAYAVASVGPAKASLRYASSLVRGRFWRVFGRLLIVDVIVIVVSLVIPWAVSSLGFLWFLGDVIEAAVLMVLTLPAIIFPVILYLDLGGETDKESETA